MNTYVSDNEQALKERNFLCSLEGRNEKGEPNVAISCSLMMYSGKRDAVDNELNYRPVSTRYITKGDFRLEIHGEFAQVDIKFDNSLEKELGILWRILENYGKTLSDVTLQGNKEEEIPLLVFNILPLENKEDAYLSFVNPAFWFLQPPMPGENQLSVIRIVAMADNFHINELPKEVDYNAIKAESERSESVNYSLRNIN